MTMGAEMASGFQSIGIIGAGQMGSGIAQVCAAAGLRVYLNDVSDEKINSGIARITKSLQKRRDAGKITDEQVDKLLSAIVSTPKLRAFEQCDLVIEAATEDEATKRKIFGGVYPFLSPTTVLATNTSSISITRLATATDRPQRFIGIHFMNPVPTMKLVEVIRGLATDQTTYDATAKFVAALGKLITTSEDYPGFIVNRVLIPMINEAVYALYEGVGSIQSIDDSLRLGANHPMGPLQLADFIGLDTCLSIMQVLHEGLADSKYRPCPLLVKHVEAGWLGVKTGRGFYDYASGAPVPLR